jgi:pectate lyase
MTLRLFPGLFCAIVPVLAGACGSTDEGTPVGSGGASGATTGSGGSAAATGGGGAGNSGTSGTVGGSTGTNAGGSSGGFGASGGSTGSAGGTGGGGGTGGASGAAAGIGGSAGGGGSTAGAGGADTGTGGSGAGGSDAGTGGSTSGADGSAGTAQGGGGSSGDCPVELVGWAATGQGTTGGGTAPAQTVTSFSELQDLARDSEPRVIHLSGSVSGILEITSNKTIVGVDKNATLIGGITVRDSNNIIIRNLNVKGGDASDAIGVRGSHHIWFDHLNVWDGPDGIVDLTRGTDHCTVSWSKFWYTDAGHDHRLALLFGGGSTHDDTDEGKNNHTVHHNWFAELVDQRMPRLLFGQGHVFNNYYNSPGNTYCIGSGSWASLLVENNYFHNVNDPHRFQDGNPSYIAATGNVYDNTSGKRDTGLGGSGSNPPGPWTPSYSYSLDPAESVPDLVKRCAGPQ